MTSDAVTDYPSSLEEIIDDVNYRKETINALKRFKRLNPWKGDLDSRITKFCKLHLSLCEIYGIDVKFRCHPSILENSHSGQSNYNPISRTITLHGRLSVLTFLHEWGHALKGRSEREACRWSVNLFRRVFPDNFERLRNNARGHFLSG